MTPEKRIQELEAALAASRKAAVHMMVDMGLALAKTPEDREQAAMAFDEAAEDPDPAIAEMAAAVAKALRQRCRLMSETWVERVKAAVEEED